MKLKIKTKRAAAKRFKITASGKVKRHAIGHRHILEHKLPGRKRQMRGTQTVNASDMKKVQKMLPGLL